MRGKIVPIWDKARVFVIGGGPSLRLIDPEIFRGKRLVVCNNAYKLFPFAQVLYFMDCSWWSWHREQIRFFKGLKYTTCNRCATQPGVIFLEHGYRSGFDTRPDHLSRGSNSGHGALNLAIRLGATEVCLVGFDMQVGPNGENNYHDEHQRSVPPTIYKNQHIKSFKRPKSMYDEMGVKIINCTPNSALKLFPIEPLENWL